MKEGSLARFMLDYGALIMFAVGIFFLFVYTGSFNAIYRFFTGQ